MNAVMDVFECGSSYQTSGGGIHHPIPDLKLHKPETIMSMKEEGNKTLDGQSSRVGRNSVSFRAARILIAWRAERKPIKPMF